MPPPTRHLLLVLSLVVTSTSASSAEVDCFSAAAPTAEKQWAEAERRLRVNLAAEACAEHGPMLRYGLAYVLEQRAPDNPDGACEAETLYGAAAATLTDANLRTAARGGARRAAVICHCQPPREALAEGAWAEAVEAAEVRARRLECAPYLIALRTAQARALEAWSGEAPEIACRAADALDGLAGEPGAPPEFAARATVMRRVCTTHAAPDPASADPSDPAVATAPDDTLSPWVLGVGAAAFAAAGAGLLTGAVAADGRRSDARARYLDAADPTARARAADDFESADVQASGLALGGWAALAVGAGLGVTAIILAVDDPAPPVEPMLGPGAAGVRINF